MSKFLFDTAGESKMTAPSQGTVPAGTYNVKIVSAEEKPCNGGKGLHVQFEIVAGDHKGHIIKDFSLTEHSSEEALSRARGKIVSMILATGKVKLQTTGELIGKIISIELNLVDNEWENKEGKTIKGKRNEIIAIEKAKSGNSGTASNFGGFDDDEVDDVPF